MSEEKQKDNVLVAPELIVEGAASSEATTKSKQAAVYLAGLVLTDQKGVIDAEKTTAILSIIEMASEMNVRSR
ncbi:hypothetical protein [Vibrio brasiliensis]|uniref:hypothetical protein n=1 Tax=Vibrio brasiliensis TaxID=170652 RepID=UPI001EFE1418|nr:hypothetical protein [Vibrio brasiliensis]MCG9724496.1 hypothetical protein [Vibrio brasiliensis]